MLNRRYIGKQLTSGPVLALAAIAITHIVTTVYQAGYRHILVDGPREITVAAEVTANLRAYMLLALSSFAFILVGFITSRFGLLFRWRTTAFAVTVLCLLLEITAPFFDLYQWVTVCVGAGIYFVALLEAVLQYLERVNPSAKVWLSGRSRLFEDKVEEARAARHRDLDAIGGSFASFVLDVLLIVFCLSVLACWCGEAHAMKHLHLW